MASKPRSRNWIWFFLVLGALGIAAVGINAVYNFRQQLTLEELTRSRTLWEKNGPRDYVMEYTKQVGGQTDTFVVTVRNGDTVLVEGPLVIAEGRSKKDIYSHYGMDAIFDDIERFLKIDAQPNSPRAFNRATFDPADGRLLDFVRSVSATRHRVHIAVKRFEPAAVNDTGRGR